MLKKKKILSSPGIRKQVRFGPRLQLAEPCIKRKFYTYSETNKSQRIMQRIITPCTKLSVEVSSNGLLEEKQQNMYALKHMYMCVCI